MRRWRHGTLFLLALLAFAAPLRAQENWQEYTFPKHGFAIRGPAQPMETVSEVPSNRGPITLTSFVVDGQAVRLMVIVEKLAPSDTRSEEELLKEGFKSAVGQILPVQQSGLKGYSALFSLGDVPALMQIFVANRTRYMISAAGSPGDVIGPEATEWLYSWRTLKPEELRGGR